MRIDDAPNLAVALIRHHRFDPAPAAHLVPFGAPAHAVPAADAPPRVVVDVVELAAPSCPADCHDTPRADLPLPPVPWDGLHDPAAASDDPATAGPHDAAAPTGAINAAGLPAGDTVGALIDVLA